MLVQVGLRLQYQALLLQLQLVQQEHQDDTDYQGDERGIEGHTKTLSDSSNVPLNSLMRLPQRIANTPDRADEPDGWNRPGDVADDLQFRFQSLTLGFGNLANRRGSILDISGCGESLQGNHKSARQQE